MRAIQDTCLLLVTALAAVACAGLVTVPREEASQRWWETAVIYQIYPRSFKDSNGDGIGDLKGITSKLEYLQDLGVGAVWLSPIYPSPQADFGYDISNFTNIDPQYGNLDDFDNLLKKTHDLGMKLVLDFVPNHSSDEHEWFKMSVKKIDPYTNYYVWKDGKKLADGSTVPPNNWLSNFRGSAWEFNEERGQYYLHQFAVKQPDLNYRNADLVQSMKDALKFWLDRGVDGFRVDAVNTLFEVEDFRDEVPANGGEKDPEEHGYLIHNYTENLPETYDMVSQWRALLDEYDGDRVMMTESYGSIEQVVDYYGTPEKPGASFTFNFNLILSLGPSSKAQDFKNVIDDWMGRMNDFRRPNWVVGNHDQHRVAAFARYGPELADGIIMIALLLPGTAMTYNGEEIGMEDTFIAWDRTLDPQAVNEGEANYLAKSRDLDRTPFQWDASTSAGFSTSKRTWLPINPNYWRLNLKAQEEAEHSHLKMYKALVQARKQPAVQSQNYKVDTIGEVLVITRQLEGQDTFIVVVNLGTEETTVNLTDLGQYSTLWVWTSSVSSNMRTGDSTAKSLNLKPKESLLLTTGTVKKNSSTSLRAVTALSLILPLFCVLQL